MKARAPRQTSALLVMVMRRAGGSRAAMYLGSLGGLPAGGTLAEPKGKQSVNVEEPDRRKLVAILLRSRCYD
jgi:hypothetical protein